MSVVGFDFGTEFCRVGVARQSRVEVLQNETGNRLTPALVSFAGNKRVIGDNAALQQAGNIKNTVSHMKRLLGKSFDDPETKLEQQYLRYKTVNLNGSIGIEVNYSDNTDRFLPEQITGSLFTNLKATAERGLGHKVTDCVISVPCFWTEQQRNALLTAAQIAGLNVLRLINEPTAVALSYGLLRTVTTPQKMIFYDMGSSSTQAVLAQVEGTKLTVLATAYDRNLGGRDFDLLLVNHMVNFIKTKFKMDPTTEPKAMFKLFRECMNVKKILSANQKKEFNVECLMNDKDVRLMIERTEFEKWAESSGLLDRVAAPLQALIDQAKITKNDLHSVEIVGGAVRVPMIQSKITSWLGREVSKTCDGDDSVAKGATLMCGMSSTHVRVRQYQVIDCNITGIRIGHGPVSTKTDPADIEKDVVEWQNVFAVNDTIPCHTHVNIVSTARPIQVVLQYEEKSVPSGYKRHIARYIIKDFPQDTKGAISNRVKVSVSLDVSGHIKVTRAEFIENLPSTATATPTSPTTPAAADATATATAAPAATAASSAASTTSSSGSMDTSADKKDKEDKTEKKRSTLKVEEVDRPSRPTHATVTSFIEKETAMYYQDVQVAETLEARNNLESYCYDMRNKLDANLASYVSKADKEALLDAIRATLNWLDGDGYDVAKAEYKKKHAELKAKSDQIEYRRSETESRNDYVLPLRRSITTLATLAASTDAQYAYIAAGERKKVTDAVAEAGTWLEAELRKQEGVPHCENPTLTTQMLQKKRTDLEALVHSVMKPQPAAPKTDDKKDQPQPQQQQQQQPAANQDKMDTNA